MTPESLKQAREAALQKIDCGDSSCRYATNKNGMRTNGGCRCAGNASFEMRKYLYFVHPSFAIQLLDHVDALENKLEKAREALEFYASIGNWQSSTENFGDPEDRIAITDVSGFIRTGEQLCGGRRARAVLKELKS